MKIEKWDSAAVREWKRASNARAREQAVMGWLAVIGLVAIGWVLFQAMGG